MGGKTAAVNGFLAFRSVGVTPTLVHVVTNVALVGENAFVVVVVSPALGRVTKGAA